MHKDKGNHNLLINLCWVHSCLLKYVLHNQVVLRLNECHILALFSKHSIKMASHSCLLYKSGIWSGMQFILLESFCLITKTSGSWVRKKAPVMQVKYKIHGFNPWVGKIPWRKPEKLTSVSLPGESHGQRSLAGCSSWIARVGHDLAGSFFLFNIKQIFQLSDHYHFPLCSLSFAFLFLPNIQIHY